MDNEFWLQRWEQGQTGFHQERVMPLLQKHWPGLELAPDARVLVPLAGKSLDIKWLAEQGHPVLAVEISPLAVKQFFEEHQLKPAISPSGTGTFYSSGNISFFCGDIFKLDAATLSQYQACYDRAALVALPPDLRARYVSHVYSRLPAGCRTLLLTLEYPQDQMQGPPFSVSQDEVRQHFGARWQINVLEQRSILEQEPRFAERGLSRMETAVYSLFAT